MIGYILFMISCVFMIVFAIMVEHKDRELKRSYENEEQLVTDSNTLRKKYETNIATLKNKYESCVKEKRDVCQKNVDLAKENFKLQQDIARIEKKSQYYLDVISYFNQILPERISPIIRINDSDIRKEEWSKTFNIIVDKVNKFMKKSREVK